MDSYTQTASSQPKQIYTVSGSTRLTDVIMLDGPSMQDMQKKDDLEFKLNISIPDFIQIAPAESIEAAFSG